jgi:hypothetical protein
MTKTTDVYYKDLKPEYQQQFKELLELMGNSTTDLDKVKIYSIKKEDIGLIEHELRV